MRFLTYLSALTINCVVSRLAHTVIEPVRQPKLSNDITEGDIHLTEEQYSIVFDSEDRSRSRRQAMRDLGYSWPNWTVPVDFAPGYPEDRYQPIFEALTFWTDNTCVRFKRANGDNDYLEIRDSISCSSNMGRIGGVQGLNLGENCMTIGTIAHEVAHTLGLFHTQSRYDRDDYVGIEWENIEENMRHNFKIENMDTADTFDIPYEFGSVMHYSEFDFGMNTEKPTLIAKTPNTLYQHSMLGRMPTFFDVLLMNHHLNCFSRCSNSIKCENGGVQDVNNCTKCKCPMGWDGNNCESRPPGTIVFNVTSNVQRYRHKMGDRNVGTTLFYQKQYYLFRAPFGHRIQFTPTVLGTQWTNSCETMGIEVQVHEDPRFAGVQICDWRVKYPAMVSSKNELMVLAYTRGGYSVIDFAYALED